MRGRIIEFVRGRVMGAAAWAVLVVALAAGPARAGGPLEPAPGVVAGELDNGLRYVAVERGVARGAVWLVIDAGSTAEPEGRNGVAELVTRLTVRWAAHFEEGEVERLFRPTDAVLGRPMHAMTSYDHTLFALGLGGRGAGLEEALIFCADALGTPAWGDDDAERERASLLEKARLTDRSYVRVQDGLLGRIAPGCALIGAYPGGSPGDIAGLTPADARAFRERWYTPSNALVVVVSDQPGALVERQIRSSLGGVAGGAPWRGEPADDPRADGRWLEDRSAPAAAVVVEPSLPKATVGLVRLGAVRGAVETAPELEGELLDRAVAAAVARRLERERRERRLPGASVDASARDVFGVVRVVQAGADGPAAEAEAMVRAVHGAVADLVARGADRVDRQAAWREVGEGFEARARETDASEVAWWFASRAHRGDALAGPEAYAEAARRLARETAPDAFDRRLRELFGAPGLITVVQTPEPLGEGAVLAAAASGRAVRDPIDIPLADASGLFEPAGAPGAVEELTRHPATGVTSAWLTGGVRVLHREMRERPGRVIVRLTLAGGPVEEGAGERGAASAAVGALGALAARGVPGAALARALDERGIEVEASGEPDAVHVTVSAPAEELGAALAVARAVLSGAVAEPGAVEAWRDRFGLARAREEREAFGALEGEVRRAWMPEEAWPLTREDARAVDAARVQAWLDRLASAPAAVSIVGDVAWHAALEAAAGELGGLSERPRIGARRSSAAVGPGQSVRHEVTLAHAEGAAAVAWGFGAPALDEIGRARALVAASDILSERLKGELVGAGPEGGALAAWASYHGDDAWDRFARVGVVMLADPERADELVARAEALAIGLSVDGPTADELEAFRARADESVRAALADPAHWARVLGGIDLRGRSLDDVASMASDYRRMGAARIREELRSALGERARYTVIVRPGE